MSAHVKFEMLEGRKLFSIVPGADSAQIGNTLYFSHWDDAHGQELWKSDLDGSNAQLVKDIDPGFSGTTPDSSSPTSLFNFNGTLVFEAQAREPGAQSYSIELFKSDGTADGTVQLTSSLGQIGYSHPAGYTILNGRLLFIASYENNLYSTDGTPQGTFQLFSSDYQKFGAAVTDLLGVENGLLYFEVNSAQHGENKEIWQTDGTPQGTRHVPSGVRIFDGFLDVEGTAGNDDIQISADATTTTVTLNGTAFEFDSSAFQTIHVDGFDGNDKVFLTPDVKQDATLLGGSGNDTLTGGGGNDWLLGGLGNDTADYSSETVPLSSSAEFGAPTIITSDRGKDYIRLETLVCGSGDDQLGVHSTISDGLQSIDGGPGNDAIGLDRNEPGGAGIRGGAGNDTLQGSHYGSDLNYGSFGIDGGDGDDSIRVDPRARTSYHVNGGAGYDVVTVGLRWPDEKIDSYLSRYPGVEGIIDNGRAGVIPTVPPAPPPPPPPPPPPEVSTPVTPPVVTTVHLIQANGTTGNDRITLRHKNGDAGILQLVVNGKITNYAFASDTIIRISGSNGNDFINLQDIAIGATILGGNGNDSILGSQAGDSIDGGRGDDYLCGMGGNDSITGGIGADFIRGGEGTDRLVARIGFDDTAKNKGDSIINDILG